MLIPVHHPFHCCVDPRFPSNVCIHHQPKCMQRLSSAHHDGGQGRHHSVWARGIGGSPWYGQCSKQGSAACPALPALHEKLKHTPVGSPINNDDLIVVQRQHTLHAPWACCFAPSICMKNRCTFQNALNGLTVPQDNSLKMHVPEWHSCIHSQSLQSFPLFILLNEQNTQNANRHKATII